MSWRRLPSEIQLQVIDELDRGDWKRLRLVSRSISVAGASRLFRTINLTPNSRSFKRAAQVASSQNLSRYVRSIVFHIGILEEVHNGFETFRDDVIRLHKPIGSTDAIMTDLLWKYNCFLEEIEGQQEFEARDAFVEMKSICQSFRNIDSITTILDEQDPFVPPKDFIGLRTGTHASCSAEGSHFSDLFNAVAGNSLNRVRGWSISWRCLPRILEHKDSNTIGMQNLSELALGLFNSEFLTMNTDESTASLLAFDTFLRCSISPQLRAMDLDFDEIPSDIVNTELQPISEVLFRHKWPRLRKLALQGIAATEDDIVDFLEKHRVSLKDLHLDDITILETCSEGIEKPEDDSSDKFRALKPGSVLSVFRRVAESLMLDSACISGTFTNSHTESWWVNVEAEHKDNLRQRIEMWLAQKAPSPFPQYLLYPESREKHPHYLEDITIKTYSDDSWIWDSE